MEVANFVCDNGRDHIATIYKDENHILEVCRDDGQTCTMTIHRFNDSTGLWEDLSIKMPTQRFAVLGTVYEGP